ncbi:MAG: BON domain-containing protein [Elusimicrobia bacterium]|nr:BON domain-containing protein [Elusimicrobiota bacterium]
MKAWMRVLAGAVLALGLGACLRNVEPVDLSDAAIKARIETALRSQPNLDLRYLTIDVDTGVVTLSGVLKDRREQDLVSRIARRTKGVDQVLVNIFIPE